MLPDRQVLVLEAHPAAQALGRIADQLLLAAHALEVRDLALRPLHVAEVGDEEPLLRSHQTEPVRPPEAGQVADVDDVRDEQRVELALPQSIDEPIRARGAHGPSSPFSSSRASLYPSTPLPCTCPTQTSLMTEWRLHSSRLSMSDRCTSTAGSPLSSIASR